MNLIRSILCYLRHGNRGLSRFRMSFIKTVSGKTVFIKTCIWCEQERSVGECASRTNQVGVK